MKSAHALAALGLATLLALPALAGDDDDKAYELKILAKAKKGLEETVEIDATVERPGARGGVSGDVLKASYKRKVRSVDEDGLPEKEILTVDKAELSQYEASPDGSSSRSSTGSGANGITLTIERTGRARRASGVGGDKLPQLPGVSTQLMEVLRRDPDGIAALAQPDEPMSVGDEWNVNRAELLSLLGPPRVVLVKKGSRAAAQLVSIDRKGERTEAHIEVTATLLYTEKDAAEDAPPARIKLKVKLVAAIDGSAPPRSEETTISSRDAKGAKETCRIKVTRTAVESAKKDDDEDETPPAKKDAKADKPDKPDK